MIGGDFNAKSGVWYSNELEERGSLLEDLIMAHNLVVKNEPSELTTFEDSRGRGTNIDATLMTRRIRINTPWRVQDDCHSDHRRITYAVTIDGMPEINLDQVVTNEESYDLKKANWPALVRIIRNNLESIDWASLRANHKARVLQEVIKAYRTVSHEAMWVVSGFPPLVLKIAEIRGTREDKALGIDKKVSAMNRENTMISA